MALPATPRDLLHALPGQAMQGRSVGSDDDLGLTSRAALQDLARYLVCYRDCTILGAINTGGISSNGGTVDTTAIQIDLTTCDILLGGRHCRIDALNDQPIFGSGAWARSLGLDGEAAVMPSANGKTMEAALVAVLVNGAAVLYLICGDEDDDGSQAAPTEAQIQAALAAAEIPDRDPTVGLIITRLKIARGASTTITLTHGAPSSTASLEAERHHGCVWPSYEADGLSMPEVAG